MKRSLILLMGVLLILTGCQDKDKTSDKTTSTSKMTSIKTSNVTTEAVLDKEDDETPSTTSVNEGNNITTNTVVKSTTTSSKDKTTTTSSAYNPTTSTTKKSSTTKSTSKSTTKSTTTKKSSTTTTTTKKSTTTTTTKKTTTTVKSTLTDKDVYNKMIALKSKYPTGTPWSNAKCYDWKGGIINTGCGCAGFAFTLSDAAFGSAKAKQHSDVSKIRVGDILRMYNDTHSVIVLEVNSTGVVVAEGNMTIVGSFENGVYWGRKISNADLKKDVDYIYTRW